MRTRRAGVAAILVLALGALAMWFVAAPANPEPRDGTVLPGGVVVAWSPAYRVSFFGIERLHPFDIGKLDRVAAHLVDSGRMRETDFWVPPAVTDAELEAVHEPAYLASLHHTPDLARALEVPVPDVFPRSVVERRVLHPFRKAVGGTAIAVRGALAHGVGINVGGGFHHARPDLGHGFCIYNDVAWALHVARAEGLAGDVLIVDTDAHQGDGNHAAFRDDPRVTTFSMHGGHLFPDPKVPGDLDLEAPPGMDDAWLLERVGAAVERLLDEKPYALVVHVAGSDVLSDDPLADFAVTPDGLVARDAMVFRAARSRGIPYVHLLAGGYGPSSATAQARSLAGLLDAAKGP